MKVMISTFGTHGDVQPFLALGQGLRAEGHTVAICTSASYRPIVEALGLQISVISDTMLDLTRALLNGSDGTLAVIRRMGPAMRAMLEEEWHAAQAFAPDMLVFHPKMLGSPHIAEKLGIPLAVAIPMPLYTPTRAFPHPFFGGLRLGGWVNRASFHLMSLTNGMYRRMTNRFTARSCFRSRRISRPTCMLPEAGSSHLLHGGSRRLSWRHFWPPARPRSMWASAAWAGGAPSTDPGSWWTP
jgi:sterol 3beta-glucosyltransferase